MNMPICRVSLFTIVCLSCSCTGIIQDDNHNGDDMVIDDNVLVYVGLEAAQVIVEEDQLVFPLEGNEDLLERNSETILVGDRGGFGTNNPEGFLRRIESVSQQDDQIIVTTRPAVLSEVFVHGWFNRIFEPNENGQYGGGDVIVKDNVTLKLIDISGEQLLPPNASITHTFEINGKEVKVKVTGSAEVTRGTLTFTPAFDIGMTTNWGEIEEFHAYATGAFQAELAVAMSAEVILMTDLLQSFGDSSELEDIGERIAQNLASATAETLNLKVFDVSVPLPTFFVGPVPVSTSLDFEVGLGCTLAFKGAADFEGGVGANASVTVGVSYENGEWNPMSSQSFDPYVIGPNWTVEGGVSLTCYLKPTVTLKFYGVIGPYFFLKPYYTAGVNYQEECDGLDDKPDRTLFMESRRGISGGVGAKLEIFSNTLADAHYDLFDLTLNSSSVSIPLGYGGFGHCTPLCGNDTLDPGEECDDGNSINGDGCSSDCIIESSDPVCGNGVLESGEECDDGNTTGGDGCSATCEMEGANPVCGNGIHESGEECDDGNTTNGDGCSATCEIEASNPVCGNGIHESGEECDDGNTTNGDGCSATCEWESTSDPCDGKANGDYCGNTTQFPGGNSGTLYTCSGDVTVDTEVCTNGCHVSNPGVDDYCESATCTVQGHMGTSFNGESCAGVPDNTWRCASSTTECGSYTTQVCQSGTWQNYTCSPTDCSACCGSWSTACEPI